MAAAILKSERVHDGYLRIERLTLRLPGGDKAQREVESHGDAIAVLPYDPQRRTALVVRLFRAPPFAAAGLESLEEACAGMIEDSDPQATARREAEEELGYRLHDLEPVATVWSSAGVTTERVSLYLGPYGPSDRVGEGGGLAEEHENITVVERPLADLAADAAAGRIADVKLLTLVLSLQVRRPDLFA